MFNLIINIKEYKDKRGNLYVAENGDNLPFDVVRCFWITNVGANEVRGAHAHRTCAELLVAVAGEFSVMVTDGTYKEIVRLNAPNIALHIPPYTWCELYDFTDDAVCLCMASQAYDADGYVNDFEEYKAIIRDGKYI